MNSVAALDLDLIAVGDVECLSVWHPVRNSPICTIRAAGSHSNVIYCSPHCFAPAAPNERVQGPTYNHLITARQMLLLVPTLYFGWRGVTGKRIGLFR